MTFHFLQLEQIRPRSILSILFILLLAHVKGQDTAQAEKEEMDGFVPSVGMEGVLPLGYSLFLDGEYVHSDHFSSSAQLGFVHQIETSLIPVFVGTKAYYPGHTPDKGNFHFKAQSGTFLIPWEGGLSFQWGYSASLGRTTPIGLEYGLRYRSFLNTFVPYRIFGGYISYRFR